MKCESAGKPGSVLCCQSSNHSSRTYVAVRLKQPTRPQRGPRQRGPIWSCSGWSLPCHELLPAARCALTAPFHPYLIPQLLRTTGHRRFALCCTGRRLAPPRRYLAPCPVEPGLSSPCLRRQRLPWPTHGADYTQNFARTQQAFAVNYSAPGNQNRQKDNYFHWKSNLCNMARFYFYKDI